MDTSGLNSLFRDYHDPNEPSPSSDKTKTHPEDLKPTSKGVENAKKRLRAFSIQKKSSLSPIPPPKTICTTVGSVGTVFIGKLATSKPVLKPGDIEEVLDPKKPPKPPKPGTSKLQNVTFPLADYLNIQKKTLSEIEAMKRKMELVDLGIPLGLICPVSTSDKAMPTKAMPPIKSMLLDPAKVDEIIREAKKAKAEGKSFKFSYEKLLPTYQNPFQKNKDKEVQPPPIDDHRQSRDRRKYSDKYRRYSSHSDEKKSRDWHRDTKDRMRANIIRDREDRVRLDKIRRSKERSKRDEKSKTEKSKTDVKPKEKDSKEKNIDTINLSDEDDDDVQEVIGEVPEKEVKEADVNLKDFVVCDSWSENEEKTKDLTPNNDKKEEKKDSDNTPVAKHMDPMEQLKQSLLKEIDLPVECKVEKLQPVTDTFKYEIEDENDDDDDEILDMFSEGASVKKVPKSIHKSIPHKTNLYDALVPIRFDYNDDNSNDAMDDSFLESVIAEIKQEDIDDDIPQDKGLVEYDISPKDERESVTPELDDKIREMYSCRSDYSDGFKSVESIKSIDSVKSVESVKSTESGFKSTESGYKSTESRYKSTESLSKIRESSEKPTDSPKLKESGRKSIESRSKSTESVKSTDSGSKINESRHGTTERSQRSTERSQRSTERSQRSTKNESTLLNSIEPHAEEVNVNNMSKSTVDSLETWSFVMKICQPLLFRHDKSKCYKESPGTPKIWWCENPKLCDCVKDRSVVYEELEMCKMELVDSLYGTYQVQEAIYPEARGWYPAAFLTESESLPLTSEWEGEDSQERPTPPPRHTRDEMVLDREYQKFMEAVWPEVEGAIKSETPRSTPVRETKKRPGEEPELKKKKMKLSEGKQGSEGWSQESEVDVDLEKNKKQKVGNVKRKRKHSPDSEEESPSKKKKKAMKKEKKEKAKTKTKRQRLSKKYLKKLKMKQEKQLKKKKVVKIEESDADEPERERKKREKKLKKKKLLKTKKKSSKKKSKARSSSPSSSDSEPNKKKKKEKRKKRKKRKQSTSDSNQSELFDVNILKNIKTERVTDDEKAKNYLNKKHREIINVKQLQNDFVSIQIKKEVEDVNSPDDFEESFTEEEKQEMENEVKMGEIEQGGENKEMAEVDKGEGIEVKEKEVTLEEKYEHEFKEPECTRPQTPQQKPHADENNSQCSSQESIISVKPYEKDDSHLRPSSQNSNYNFHDVMQNVNDNELYAKDGELEMEGGYEQGNYEMYEQMAMEYQSDVASQRVPPPDEQTCGRIETVVMSRTRGEIKCDWRAGDPPTPPPARRAPPPPGGAGRPSRWGLKPSEVNIVLTGGCEEQADACEGARAMSPTVYRIQSLANRTDNSNSGYDEAYMDMYGAADRLQYGDCFSREPKDDSKPTPHHSSSLDDRINLALRTTVQGDVPNNEEQENEEDNKGILVTKSLAETRPVKRVSFADGYKPGQDSDTEEPPVRKRKKARRTGCPWPCPATHRDHVSLWDALPPPPPPPGSPPPPPAAPPAPASLLRAHRPQLSMLQQLRPPHPMNKFEPSALGGFMPPEPPPGLISF